MGRFDGPDEVVEAIRQRAEISDVVGRYISLKKKGGRNLWGCCPFHNEKTPSFSVLPGKGYNCFGCGAKGDVFKFVMEYEGIDFGGAKRKLAEMYSIAMESESPEVRQRREQEERIFQVNEIACAFFAEALWQPAAGGARNYLSGRAIPEDFAREQRIGFGGNSKDLFTYLQAKNVTLEMASAAGLLNEAKTRSLFDGRLIFPIADRAGRIVGFGARRLGDESSGPKYVNTRETLLFKKSELLYGWATAHKAIRLSKRVLVVEGYTDVLACVRAGLPETVAALGTAFTDDHAKLCASLAEEGIVLLDADPAGMRASRKASEKLIKAKAKFKTYVAALPVGEDPDSLLREKGPEALRAIVDAKQSAAEYFIDVGFAREGMSTDDKVEAAGELATLIDAYPDRLKRDILVSRLAGLVGVSTEQIKEHLAGVLEAAAKKQKKKQQHQREQKQRSRDDAWRQSPGPPMEPPVFDGPPPDGAHFVEPPMDESGPDEFFAAEPAQAKPMPAACELEMLRQLLLYPDLRVRFEELAGWALTDAMGELLSALAKPESSVDEVVANYLPEVRWGKALGAIEPATERKNINLEEQASKTYEDVERDLKRRYYDERIGEVIAEMRECESAGKDVTELVKKRMHLKSLQKKLMERR